MKCYKKNYCEEQGKRFVNVLWGLDLYMYVEAEKHFESETHYYPLFQWEKIITIDHKTISKASPLCIAIASKF